MRVALTRAAVSGLPGGAALVPAVAAAPTAVGAAMAGAVRVGAAEDDEAPRVRRVGAIGTRRTLTPIAVPSWAPMHPVVGGAGHCHDGLHTPGRRPPRASRDGGLDAQKMAHLF